MRRPGRARRPCGQGGRRSDGNQSRCASEAPVRRGIRCTGASGSRGLLSSVAGYDNRLPRYDERNDCEPPYLHWSSREPVFDSPSGRWRSTQPSTHQPRPRPSYAGSARRLPIPMSSELTLSSTQKDGPNRRPDHARPEVSADAGRTAVLVDLGVARESLRRRTIVAGERRSCPEPPGTNALGAVTFIEAFNEVAHGAAGIRVT